MDDRKKELLEKAKAEGRDSIVPTDGKPPFRYHLPDERKSRTVKFIIGEYAGYFRVGLFEDGSPGEIFINMSKQDTEFCGFAEMWAISVSMLMQFGIPHEKIYDKFQAQDFPPHGVTNLPDVPVCKSIVDLIIKYLRINFPPTRKEGQDDYDRMIDQ